MGQVVHESATSKKTTEELMTPKTAIIDKIEEDQRMCKAAKEFRAGEGIEKKVNEINDGIHQKQNCTPN